MTADLVAVAHVVSAMDLKENQISTLRRTLSKKLN